MSTPRYRSAPPSRSGSAISVSNATTPSSPGLNSDMRVPPAPGQSRATGRPRTAVPGLFTRVRRWLAYHLVAPPRPGPAALRRARPDRPGEVGPAPGARCPNLIDGTSLWRQHHRWHIDVVAIPGLAHRCGRHPRPGALTGLSPGPGPDCVKIGVRGRHAAPIRAARPVAGRAGHA